MGFLTGKLCLVTGAARGIGAGVAKAFLKEGADVVLSDINHRMGDETAARLGARYLPLDVRSEEDWASAEEALGHLDVLVNNAGVTGLEDGAPHDPERASLGDWRAVHAVNLDGVFLGCRTAIRLMRETGEGSIINISSRSGLVGVPAAAAYASSKAAVRNHSKSVALHCAGAGLKIRCNSVHPAAILTEMWEPMLGDGPDRASRMAAFVADTPLKRFGAVEEVAALCIYLASDASAYVTGTEFHIDGGLLAGSAAAVSRE